MSARERVLATLVAIAVVVLVLYLGVNNYVIEPRQRLVEQIGTRQADIAKLRKRLKTLPGWQEEWRERTAATLAADEHDVQSRFKEDVHRLLIEAGFRAPDVAAPNVQSHPHFREAGFREVTLKVDVTGEIAKLERFLKAYYQRPYYNGIRRMTIDAPQPKRRRGDDGPPPEPQLDISLTATTLVLPPVLDLEHLAFNEDDPNGLPPRLARDAATYDKLASSNPFKKWVKPKPPPPPPPPVEDEPKREPVVVEKPPPPPPNKTLVGVVAIEGRYYGYVRDDDRLELEPEEVSIGSTVDGGEVLLIHPDGLVVRAAERRGDDEPLVEFFYPLGRTFAERETLDAKSRPRVYAAFARAYGAELSAEPE